MGDELLHQSERTRVTRVFLPGRTVIRKEPLGRRAAGRMRHELAMLDRLRGVAGVAQLLDAPRYPGSIVLADGGASLSELEKPPSADDLLGIAVELARAVAGMHGRGVIDRDITPANVVRAPDGRLCLVDFALATWPAAPRFPSTWTSRSTGGSRNRSRWPPTTRSSTRTHRWSRSRSGRPAPSRRSGCVMTGAAARIPWLPLQVG